MRDTTDASLRLETVCRQCETASQLWQIPYGKTGRYLQVFGCKCLATRMTLRFENVKCDDDISRERGNATLNFSTLPPLPE